MKYGKSQKNHGKSWGKITKNFEMINLIKIDSSRSHRITTVSQFSTSVEVRPGNVGQSVRDKKLQRTALRIFLKLGNYLGIDILRKLTKPFFRKKILILIKKFKRAFLGTLCFLNFKLRTRFCSNAQKWQIIMRGAIPENFSTRKNPVQM